jgi:hypothetical protein
MTSLADQPSSGRPRFRLRRRWLVILAVLALVIVLFKPVENWRGRRAWEQARLELEAKGEKLDLTAFQPEKIPDDQNRMMHPFIRRHFSMNGVPLALPTTSYPGLPWGPYFLADLQKLPREPVQHRPFRELAAGRASKEASQLIAFDDMELSDALRSLFRQANLNVLLPGDTASLSDAFNCPIRVTGRFENATVVEVIEQLVDRYQLVAERDDASGIFYITRASLSLTELRRALESYDADLMEFDEVLRRPLASLPLKIDLDSETVVPGFVSLRVLAQGLASRAKVFALLGQREEALRDLHRLRGVMDCSIGYKPLSLVAAMIRTAIAGILADTVRELLVEKLLSPADCAIVQRELADIDLLAPYLLSVRVERAVVLDWIDRHKHDPSAMFARAQRIYKMSRIIGPATVTPATNSFSFSAWFRNFLDRLAPKQSAYEQLLAWLSPVGWVEQNKAVLVRWNQAAMEGCDPVARRIDTRLRNQRLAQAEAELERGAMPYTYLARLGVANFERAFQTCARNQTLVDEAFVACALERYRAAKGNYPEKLDALVPEFAVKLPHDLFDGQPLRYQRTRNGEYLLYSIGWNAEDDGGLMGPDNRAFYNWNMERGDWVWRGVPNK